MRSALRDSQLAREVPNDTEMDAYEWPDPEPVVPAVEPTRRIGDAKASRAYALAKRASDIIASSVLLLLSAPLLILIGILVRLDSAGPVLFIQKRVGREGELFSIYKFRSMHPGAPKYEISPTTAHDPRVTRIGRLLRGTSLDELPQLVNVLLGNMSLVGPRPEMPFIVAGYDSWQLQRLQVLPGMTGLWQLSAARTSPIHDNLHYDLWYIENRTFSLDMVILVRTLFALRGGV